MNNPKVSIIITYHNAQDTIKDCINSVLKQTFKDFELICINNASTDESEKIVIDLTSEMDFVKRISLSFQVTNQEAQDNALSISSGDYICFLDADKIFEEGFISNLFTKSFSVKNNYQNILSEKMYKRDFFENSDILDEIIKNKINFYSQELRNIVDKNQNYVREELDKNEKINLETINNKIFEIVCRFNQLEKNVYENISNSSNILDEKIVVFNKEQRENIDKVYVDITKIYEYINSEFNKKGHELGKVYEEITKNYKYTESIVNTAKEDVLNNTNQENSNLKDRVEKIETELLDRYSSLKKILDLQVNELDSKIQALKVEGNDDFSQKVESIDLTKVLNENIENIYSHMNKTNAQFYEELSKIYKELNDKLVEKMNMQQASLDSKIEALRDEFNKKLENLRGN